MTPSGTPPGEPPVPSRDDTQPLPPVEQPRIPPPAPSRGKRAVVLGCVVVALAVLALLIANGAIGRVAEQRAAERAEQAIGTPVDVQLSGWPVGLRLLLGQPVDVRLHARDVPLPDTDAVLDAVELELREVPVELDMLDQPEPELRAAAGWFRVELGEDAVSQLIGPIGRLPLVDVELRSGVARLNVARFPVIDASAEIEDGQVVFRPTAPIGTFASVALRVEQLPFGFEADEVTIRPGVLALEGSATDVRLAAP